MGIEARSFALSAAMVVWVTVVLLVATRRRRWVWWALYAALVAASTYVFFYSVLVLAVHGLFLLVHHRVRGVLVGWAIAAAAASAACVSILRASVAQKEQIAWLSDQPVVNVWTILVEPAGDSSWLVALILWASVAALVVRARMIWAGPVGPLLALASAWVAVPLALLLLADAALGPVYTARYLSFTVPGIAVLLAIAFTRPSRPAVTWALVIALAVASLPTYLAQREPGGKNGGSDLAEIAAYVRAHATLGDAIYLQDTGSVTRRPRQALYAYPESFADVADIAFEAPFTQTGTFSDRTRPLARLGPVLNTVERVWVVTASPATTASAITLKVFGFVPVRSYETKRNETNRSVVSLYERES